MPSMRIPRHPIKAVLDRMGVSLQPHPTPETLARTHPDLVTETDPTEHDRGLTEPTLNDDWNKTKGDESNPVFAFAAIDDVKGNLARTPFPADHIRYCKGPVEQTIPGEVPDKIALLRLDTDWYESTRHELEHLYPRLEPGGVLIIDDYGAWEGARRAVDEWRSTLPYPTLMHRIDETGGIIVKPAV